MGKQLRLYISISDTPWSTCPFCLRREFACEESRVHNQRAKMTRISMVPPSSTTSTTVRHRQRSRSSGFYQTTPVQNFRQVSKRHSVADINLSTIATNGPLPAAPSRASPAPQGFQGPPVPNGKPTSPYVERSNPMGVNGQASAQTVSSSNPKAAAQAASDMRNVVRRKLTGYVGFANLPNQWHRKSVRKGFNFNVMVVGTLLHPMLTLAQYTNYDRRIWSWEIHSR